MTGRETDTLCVGLSPEVTAKVTESVPGAVATVSTAEAVREATTAAVDCVVVSDTLPDGDGLSVLRTVQSRHPDVACFLYAEAGSESLAGDALAAGIDGYVPASDGPATLVDRIETALDAGDLTVESRRDRLELVYEQAPLAIIEADPSGDIVAWNDGATDLFGYDREAVLGTNLIETLVPPEIHNEVTPVCERAMANEDIDWNVNANVTSDGRTITCEWFNRTMTDHDGNVVGALSFVQDVTERVTQRQTVEDLQETTRELITVDSRDHVAEFAVDAARTVLNEPYAGVFLYDEDRDALVPTAATEPLRRVFEPDGVLREGSYSWRAFTANEPVIQPEGVSRTSTAPAGNTIESGIFMPLGDHGVLFFGTEELDAFDQTDTHMASILASATTAALDQSEREEELRRQQTIVEAAGDAVFALCEDATFRTVNDVMTEMTGYDREELLGSHATKVIDERDYQRGRAALADMLEADDPDVYSFDVTVHTADGRELPCEGTMALFPDDTGFDGTAFVMRDITERQQMADELVEQKRKIENLHDVASSFEDCDSKDDVWELAVEAAEGVLDFDICCVDSVDGEYLVSEALSSEVEPKEYKQRAHISDGIAGKTHRTGESYLVDDIQGDNEATPEAGTYRSLLSVPIGDEGVFQAVSNEPGGFGETDLELAELLMSHVQDALDRTAFEERLREERDRFAALFENVPDPVVYAVHQDGEPVVVQVNTAFERVFGYDQTEIVGDHLDDYIVPDTRDAEASRINSRSQNGELVDAEVKRRTTDGLRDFLMTVVPVDIGDGAARTFGVYTDITERKERQKRVEILNRVLRHDLRNGMNIIKGSAQMLGDVVEGTTAAGYAESIIERADELIGLAENTRAVERTLDRDQTATGPVDVCDSVRTSVSRLEQEYPHATVTTDLPEEAEARADDLLRTAIHHVIENALQHNDPDDASAHISVSTDTDSRHSLRVVVADDGPGIPDEERKLITEEQEITQLRHASGLGLWLVNWVVTQTGGTLSFAENDPHGTVVTLTVPLAVDDELVRSADD
ncbi:PAS domain S-box protein [Haloarchaeobius sp. DFWS5]|uniref:PAS domain S-box protein n=1 Tax=Haloarchaeobius sp. DFWS5 TaxID=3446114 RepID=UPI003EBEFBDF